MANKTCVFCGSSGKLTGEHVFGEWLGRIGLSADPVRQGAGPLNRTLRRMGVTRPFRWKVRDVCGTCNHGWMSRLENTAARVLTPLIRGEPGSIAEEDQGALAAWAQKTALVAMLTTSDEERARGQGLPASEYRELHAGRNRAEPLPHSQFWIGQYDGSRPASVWITPAVVRIEGLTEPEIPHAYVMTIVIGKMMFQGIRFTSEGLFFDLSPTEGFSQIWPAQGRVTWPAGSVVDDDRFLVVSKGTNLASRTPGLALRPWRLATDLPRSVAARDMVMLPAVCGRHVVRYPAALVDEAARGVFFAFVARCECRKTYLVVTEHDGAHFKRDDEEEEDIAALLATYAALPGREVLIPCSDGPFECKRLV